MTKSRFANHRSVPQLSLSVQVVRIAVQCICKVAHEMKFQIPCRHQQTFDCFCPVCRQKGDAAPVCRRQCSALKDARGDTVPAAVQSGLPGSFMPILFICVQGKALEKICWSVQRLPMTFQETLTTSQTVFFPCGFEMNRHCNNVIRVLPVNVCDQCVVANVFWWSLPLWFSGYPQKKKIS